MSSRVAPACPPEWPPLEVRRAEGPLLFPTCPPPMAPRLSSRFPPLALPSGHPAKVSGVIHFKGYRSVLMFHGSQGFGPAASTWDTTKRRYEHCQQEDFQGKPFKTQLCFTIGSCIHNTEGTWWVAFESSFIKQCQIVCPPKTQERRLLKLGFFVIKMWESETASRHHWFHVSRATLKSGDWKLTMLEFEVANVLADGDFELSYIKSSDGWQLTWNCFRRFNFHRKWEMQFFIIRSRTARAFSGTEPHQISVCTYTDPLLFWGAELPRPPPRPPRPHDNQPRAPRPRGPRAKAKPRVSPAGAAVPSVEEAGDEDEARSALLDQLEHDRAGDLDSDDEGDDVPFDDLTDRR
jgi:hypothetical protein